MRRMFLTFIATTMLVTSSASAGTESKCRDRLSSGGWNVLLSSKYNEIDTALLAACIVFTGGSGTLACLGSAVQDVANKVGWGILKDAIEHRDSVVVSGNTKAQVGICSATYPIVPGIKGTDHYIYLRYRQDGSGDNSIPPPSQAEENGADLGNFFRAVNRHFTALDNAGAFPDFEQLKWDDGNLHYGTIVVYKNAGSSLDFKATDLGLPNEPGVDIGTLFRAVNSHYRNAGYAGAFPNFEYLKWDDGNLHYGVVAINNNAGQRLDVKATDLGLPNEPGVELGAFYRAVNSYYRNAGYAGAFPDFEQLKWDNGELHYGVIVINKDSGTRADAKATDMGLPN